MVYNREKYKKDYLNTKQFVVYILQIVNKNIYKIGKTNSLKHRLINLRQSIYEEITVRHLIICGTNEEALLKEKWLHHQLDAYRIGHKEWFDVPIDILMSKVYELENDFEVLLHPQLFTNNET